MDACTSENSSFNDVFHREIETLNQISSDLGYAIPVYDPMEDYLRSHPDSENAE